MLKCMLKKRELPSLLSKNEMLDVLLKEGYGYIPPDPDAVSRVTSAIIRERVLTISAERIGSVS